MRVVIAEDSVLLREGLGRLLEEGGFEVVASVGSGPELVRAVERRRTLTREIISYRRVGVRWRRSEETHRLRLYRPTWIVQTLKDAGFRVQTIRGYGRLRFGKGWLGFVARKPPDRRP